MDVTQKLLHEVNTATVTLSRLYASPQQVRAGRQLLGWSRERLGAISETSANFIAIYENSGRAMTSCPSAMHADQLAQVHETLTTWGIEFLSPGPGGQVVRLVERRKA